MALVLSFCLAALPLCPQWHLFEAPGPWRILANTTAATKILRRHAVTQLFRRWVSPGMRLSDLARLLDKPHWLKYAFAKRIPEEPGPEDEGTIRSIVMLGNGRPPPVRVTSEDTVFVLVVFSEPGVYGDLIYLRVSGKHDTKSFLKLLAGETRGTACDATILEVGFEPDVTALIRFTIGY